MWFQNVHKIGRQLYLLTTYLARHALVRADLGELGKLTTALSFSRLMQISTLHFKKYATFVKQFEYVFGTVL